MAKNKKPNTQKVEKRNPNRITFHDQQNFAVAVWADRGKSAYFISSQTGLSIAQVYYRLRMIDIKLKNNRNALTTTDQILMKSAGVPDLIEHKLERYITQQRGKEKY